MTEQTPPRGPGPAADAEWFKRCPACGGIGEQYHPTTGGFGEPLYAPTPCPAHCVRGFVPAADPDRDGLRERLVTILWVARCGVGGLFNPSAKDYETADRILALIPPGDGLAGLLRRAMRGGLIVRFWPLDSGQVRCVVADNRSLDEGDWREWDANGDTPEAALESALRAAETRGEGSG